MGLEKPDRLIRSYEKYGELSIKSAFLFIRQKKNKASNQPSSSLMLPFGYWNMVWNLDLPAKIQIFCGKTV